MKYSAWTTYSVNMAIDRLSDDYKAILEKQIEEFIENLWIENDLEYYELCIDKIHWDKFYNLRAKK